VGGWAQRFFAALYEIECEAQALDPASDDGCDESEPSRSPTTSTSGYAPYERADESATAHAIDSNHWLVLNL